MITEKQNPYVGLRPFETGESLLFFGRNQQTLELLQRLHQYQFVAVVGSSGCGKSSLLRAGLIPALKAGYLVDDVDRWQIAIMKPGKNPLYNLVESIVTLFLEKPDRSTIQIVDQVKEEGADVILNLLAPLAKVSQQNIFLLVDQFEELFRFSMETKDSAKKDEAIDFVNIMLELVHQTQIPVYVVITMRSDFIGDCAQFYGLPEAMNESQYLVPRLNRVQLKTVIEGPAKLYGGKLNPALTSLLLNELGKVKDELPLLQHALMRMWDCEVNANKSGQLDLADYANIGGIEKALSNHADEALKGMSEKDLQLTKEMFQALTAIDENGRKIRRPALLSQLETLTGTTREHLLDIIDLFIKDSRCFLIKNQTDDSGDRVIDISHESLIRQWNALNGWVDEEADYASTYLQIAEANRLKRLNKRDFLSGTELDISLQWYNNFKPTATWANRYKPGFEETIAYLQESKQLSDAREKERLEKQRAEAQREQKQAEEKRLEKNRRRRRMIITSLLIAVAVIATLSLNLVQSRRTEIKALNDKATAEAAEERTRELLQLVVSGQPDLYKDTSYAAVVEQLRVQQSEPIEQLIVPRAIKVPITGTNLFDFLVWIDVPTFRSKEIQQVEYTWLCSGFIDKVHIGKEPSLGFAFGYRGWGVCPQIAIKVKLKDGKDIDVSFPIMQQLQQ